MKEEAIQQFADIVVGVIGPLDIFASDAMPNPWFSKDIFRKRDLQWAGYIWDFSRQGKALVFGLNLEFIPAWRRAYPRIKESLTFFTRILQRLNINKA